MPWLDVAKGIGIILVVIGHAMFPKHLIIDGFHMTLFFILSGVGTIWYFFAIDSFQHSQVV